MAARGDCSGSQSSPDRRECPRAEGRDSGGGWGVPGGTWMERPELPSWMGSAGRGSFQGIEGALP